MSHASPDVVTKDDPNSPDSPSGNAQPHEIKDLVDLVAM